MRYLLSAILPVFGPLPMHPEFLSRALCPAGTRGGLDAFDRDLLLSWSIIAARSQYQVHPPWNWSARKVEGDPLAPSTFFSALAVGQPYQSSER